MTKRNSFSLILALLILTAILAVLAYAGYYFYLQGEAPIGGLPATDSKEYIVDDTGERQNSMTLSQIPSWLFLHVTIIAGFQVLSVMTAALKARKYNLSRREMAVIQFLIEIPMYLGLFGTLLGVCLTQFISGTLVAPLAYITTMSGIILHIFGKLTIWLTLAAEEGET